MMMRRRSDDGDGGSGRGSFSGGCPQKFGHHMKQQTRKYRSRGKEEGEREDGERREEGGCVTVS